MSVLDVLFPTESCDNDPITNPALWTGGFDDGLFSSSGAHVTGTTSKTLSAYYACLRNISEDVAKLPFKVYRHVKGGKELQRNHDVYRLLNVTPNPRHTALTVREMITHWAAGHGNGYAEIEKTTRPTIEALHPIHPDRVTILNTDNDTLAYEVLNEDGSKRVIPQSRMLHIRGLGAETRGYSVFRFAVESLGRALAVQTSSASFFKNGSRLGAVLEHPTHLSEKAQARLRTTFDRKFAGVGNTGGTFIAEEGMKYSAVGIPPEEAQMIETSLFMVVDVCRWFRMPPHKIQHLADATFSNIESQAIEYVCDTLTPWLIRWEQEVNRKLFPEGSDLFAEHVVAALLRGDQVARSAFYRELFGIGVLSINEIRQLENMNPIDEGGDDHFVQMNMTDVSDAGDEDEAEAVVVPPAIPPPPTDEERASAIAEAHRSIFEATIDRMDRAQKTAADRALKRIGDDEAKRSEWAAEFYSQQSDKYDAALLPCVITLMASLDAAGIDPDACPQTGGLGNLVCNPRRFAVWRGEPIEYGMTGSLLTWLASGNPSNN